MKSLGSIYFIFSFFLATLFSFSSRANTANPQIRLCHQQSGVYFVAHNESDEFGFCQFGQAVVGTLELMAFITENQKVQAIENYQNTIPACSPSGQIENLIVDVNNTFQVCHYSDQSRIGLQTLIKGRFDQQNKKLNQVLGL